MTEEATVNVTDVKSSETSNVDMTMAEGKEAVTESKNTGDTAETLGVSQEQFDKYYKDGQYNWQAHAKEAEFKAKQKTEDKPKGTDEAPKTEAEAKESVESAGLDWDELREKVVAKGDVDESDYEALTKIGVPKEIAEEYIDSLHAKAQAHYDEITGLFGGPEALKATVDQLVKAGVYSDGDRKVLSEKLSDPREAKITANLLLQQAGKPPVTVRGGNQTAPSGSVTGYTSQAEMVADMRKPEYKKDPAFRAQVTAKARAATFTDNPRIHTGGR